MAVKTIVITVWESSPEVHRHNQECQQLIPLKQIHQQRRLHHFAFHHHCAKKIQETVSNISWKTLKTFSSILATQCHFDRPLSQFETDHLIKSQCGPSSFIEKNLTKTTKVYTFRFQPSWLPWSAPGSKTCQRRDEEMLHVKFKQIERWNVKWLKLYDKLGQSQVLTNMHKKYLFQFIYPYK